MKTQVHKYLSEIGRRGGAAGRGAVKRRPHAQCVRAGKASAAARKRIPTNLSETRK
jgi:hypothetical protein